MNNARMIERSASGCLASASKAWLIARPIARAGSIVPIAMVKPATTVETRTNQLMSRMIVPLFRLAQLLRLNGTCNVNQRKHPEDIGLDQRFDHVQDQQRYRQEKSCHHQDQ